MTTAVTAIAPVNIAVIKYWGKRDEKLILPVNGSISATLDTEHMRAKTTAMASRSFVSDRLWLNGVEQSMANQRVVTVLHEIRRRARKRHLVDSDEEDGADNKTAVLSWKVHICSENNFPTAAGLASSAAGLACMVFALAKLFGVEDDVSDIARQGSGSACRSMFGGFVEWIVGSREDGTDSIARQIATEDHWPNMRVLILVVNAGRKHIGSTEGMRLSVATSELLNYRAKELVPKVLKEMKSAILDKNYDQFAELTMKDSNQMHAACLDTYPPISYLTDTSHSIIRLVHAVNSHYNECRVAYTFDAGPNACLYLPADSVDLIVGLVNHFFPPVESTTNGQKFITGLNCQPVEPDPNLLANIPVSPSPGAIRYVIHTKVGSGPQLLTDPSESLLSGDGQPLRLNS